jgi:peptidyl-Lys metalloendopeptidase
MVRVCLLIAGLLWAGAARATTYENCSRPEAKVADAAVKGALDLALRAAAAVGETPEYVLWFGRFSSRNGEEVRANLKAIHKELAADGLKAMCLGPQVIDCKQGTFAFVLDDHPRVVHLCPSFFEMPSMAEARAGLADIEDGTREGTIIHELSHFSFIAATGDECYGRTTCSNMARRDGLRAIATADSYQYFAEDVALAYWLAID